MRYNSKGLKRDVALQIVGVSKHQYYYISKKTKQGMKTSTTSSKDDGTEVDNKEIVLKIKELYAIWLSENLSMASTRGFFHQQKESLPPDEITPTFTRKASKIRASLCQVQKGFARSATTFVGNGHKDDVDRICEKTRLYTHTY